ncbi:hypothetical protein [Cronobacter dublinensis]|uniref:hypothetical protein n=1 Tax=Cronobacter dublinensis TaxID=413497 RepID=UPI0024AFAD16|nr:hypothetical protein [Cronobacter dublinensis]MDI7385981.1 hypothetical protein [Cronobacter dublinensis]
MITHRMVINPLTLSLNKGIFGEHMPIIPKIEPRDYYKELPSIYHETGDIWTNIPSFGMNNDSFNRAIVITPACDLSQNKSETITALPIITISDYIYSKSFYYEVWQEVQQELTDAQIYMPKRHVHPNADDIKALLDLIQLDKNKRKFLPKLKEYYKYITYCEDRMSDKPDIFSLFSAKKIDKIISDITKNSYRSDIHFLPHDGSNGDGKILESHSVVLFRYAFTFPIDILDLACDGNENTWGDDMEILNNSYPLASHFKLYPINVTTLKDDFLSDLLSRYISMYMRLGSRDFTKATLSDFLCNIKEGL